MTTQPTPELLPLPEPMDYCYEWDGPYVKRKFSAALYKGRQSDRTISLYTKDQMREYALACVRALSQPIAKDEPADHELTEWVRDLVRFHSATLQAMLVNDKSVGKWIVERMNARTENPSMIGMSHANDDPVAWIDAMTLRRIANEMNGNKEIVCSLRRAELIYDSDVPLYAHPQPQELGTVTDYGTKSQPQEPVGLCAPFIGMGTPWTEKQKAELYAVLGEYAPEPQEPVSDVEIAKLLWNKIADESNDWTALGGDEQANVIAAVSDVRDLLSRKPEGGKA